MDLADLWFSRESISFFSNILTVNCSYLSSYHFKDEGSGVTFPFPSLTLGFCVFSLDQSQQFYQFPFFLKSVNFSFSFLSFQLLNTCLLFPWFLPFIFSFLIPSLASSCSLSNFWKWKLRSLISSFSYVCKHWWVRETPFLKWRAESQRFMEAARGALGPAWELA